MKHKVLAVVAAVALIGLGVAVALGGSREDPLVAKSYLEDTFPDTVAQILEKRASDGTKNTYSTAVSKLDKAGEADVRAAESLDGSLSGYRAKNAAAGDTLTLRQGASMVVFSGEGVVSQGVLSDVTAGISLQEGGKISVGHRYIASGGDEAEVRVTAPGSFGAQGTVAVTAGGGQQTGDGLPFADVRSSDWYYSAVEYVYEKKYFSGTAADTFSPGTSMTRAMLATVLYRVSGETAGNGGASFSDVPAGQWYSDGIAWAGANGIVNGMGDGTYCPDLAVSREQLVTMLYRFQNHRKGSVSAKGSLSGYPDGAEVADWAKSAMEWATGAGLVKGRDTGRLDPKGTATRAEVATILQRFETLK